MFFEGRINEALEILSEERLKRQTAEVKKQQEDVVRNWLLHGQMLAVKFDFDGAARTYKEAVEFSPGSFDAWFAYAFFHQGQNHFKEGRQGYEKALVLARASGKDEEVQRPSTTWALLHWNENRMAEARAAYEEALEIRRKLAKEFEISRETLYQYIR